MPDRNPTPKHSYQFFAAGPGPGSNDWSFKDLKGQFHKIFCFRFFYVTSSSKPLNITLGSFRMFFENSLKYFQVKVPHQYQRHRRKILGTAALVDTGGKFATVVNNTGIDTGGNCHQ
jgi:hypothetical protein